MKRLRFFVIIGIALALVLSACGRSDSGDDATTITARSQSECEGVDLEATEIGVTADKITFLVMADIGSPLAPGLFQGSIDGANAWTDFINAQGGLACRDVEVLEWDSQINPVETTNGYLEACENALAMVGSTALFVLNTEALNTCDDAEGNAIGIPDFVERAVEAPHGCSLNVFSTAGINSACPIPSAGEDQTRTYSVNRQIDDFILDTHGPLNGVFAIPSDLASAINSSMPAIRAASRVSGIVNDGEVGVSGRAEQSVYGQLLSIMRENNSNFARTGSDDQSLLKWRREAIAQGGFDDIIWGCPISCYTPSFQNAGNDVIEGTYLWFSFLPFEERDTNEELDLFLTSVGDDFPPAWAAGAWAAGRLFEQVVNDVVAEYGLNGITRARVLEAARATDSFDANGFFGNIDFTTKPNISPCIVILRVENGEYVRKWPTERGTLDCNPENIVKIDLDSAQAFRDGPDSK